MMIHHDLLDKYKDEHKRYSKEEFKEFWKKPCQNMIVLQNWHPKWQKIL